MRLALTLYSERALCCEEAITTCARLAARGVSLAPATSVILPEFSDRPLAVGLVDTDGHRRAKYPRERESFGDP
jgi:hypothetical protein